MIDQTTAQTLALAGFIGLAAIVALVGFIGWAAWDSHKFNKRQP